MRNSQPKNIKNIYTYKKRKLLKPYRPWDHPRGWSSQQWIVIKGLLNYDFNESALRLTTKWLEMNKKMFEKTGMFWEKYDIIKANIDKEGRYNNQTGFGWTNGIFVKLIKKLNIK